MKLKIATRKSPLALWQAEHVRERLQALYPAARIDLVPMTTRGDRMLDRSLATIGGKGLFLKELEEAMEDNRADLAVHSMKDVPAELPPGFTIAAVLTRHDPRDALLTSEAAGLDQLRQGARLGTSSLRRQAQLLALRPDLVIMALRGNVNTRLARLDAGDYDAIVLAQAGLERLGLADRVRETLSPATCLPAVSQGAMGIECLSRNEALQSLLVPLNDAPTRCCVDAERAMSFELGGSCQVPLGGYCQIESGQLWLRGLVGAPDGSQVLRAEGRGSADDPIALGRRVAADLRAQGADAIMEAL